MKYEIYAVLNLDKPSIVKDFFKLNFFRVSSFKINDKNVNKSKKYSFKS